MDLVGNEDQPVPTTKGDHRLELVAAINAANGIVRIAEIKHFRLGRDGGLHRFEIKGVAGLRFPQGHGLQGAVLILRGGQKGRIHRRAGQDRFAPLRKRPRGRIERRDEPGKPEQGPIRNLQTVVAAEVVAHCFDAPGGRQGVAKNTMLRPLLQCRNNRGRRRQVHVRDPHGKQVGAFVALPFQGAPSRNGQASVQIQNP
jgi:hypothetical protein